MYAFSAKSPKIPSENLMQTIGFQPGTKNCTFHETIERFHEFQEFSDLNVVTLSLTQ